MHNPWQQAVKPESLALTALLALVIASPAIYQSSQHHSGVGPPHQRLSDRGQTQPTQQLKRALVVYVYSGSDPEYEANLRFFLREAIQVSHGRRLEGSDGRKHCRWSVHRVAKPAAMRKKGLLSPPPRPQPCIILLLESIQRRNLPLCRQLILDLLHGHELRHSKPLPPPCKSTVPPVLSCNFWSSAGGRWLRLHHRAAARRRAQGPGAAAEAAAQRALRAPRERVSGHRDRRMGAGQPRARPQARELRHRACCVSCKEALVGVESGRPRISQQNLTRAIAHCAILI